MKAPIDKVRSGGNDIIQIIVTRKCDLFHCSNCTQLLPFRTDAIEMSPDVFRLALRSLEGWPGVRAIFGGNPCTHSQFPELCRIMAEEVPDQRQRGIWTNNLMTHGRLVREVFYPLGRYNLNVHADAAAMADMQQWLPGWKVWGQRPSHHGPILMDYRDFDIPREAWIAAREGCDINQNWSAAIAERDGAPYAYFCEVGASLDGVRGENHGIPAVPGWWRLGIEAFAEQVHGCCDRGCGVPLRRRGHDDAEEVYDISAGWAPLTVKGRRVEVHTELPDGTHEATDYVGLRKRVGVK